MVIMIEGTFADIYTYIILMRTFGRGRTNKRGISTCRQVYGCLSLPVTEHAKLRQFHFVRDADRLQAGVPFVPNIAHCVSNCRENKNTNIFALTYSNQTLRQCSVRDRRAGTSGGSTVIRSKVITSELKRFPLLRHDPILSRNSINFSPRGIDLGCPPLYHRRHQIRRCNFDLEKYISLHVLPRYKKSILKSLSRKYAVS